MEPTAKNPAREHQRKTFVSFSGVDGAGKSTQIEALCEFASRVGVRVLVIRFWDDVARLSRIRESSGHLFFKGEKGIGSPERPVVRRDKNVRSWAMTCVRLFLYTVDAFATRKAMRGARRSTADIVIFDRYLYDELANLPLKNALIRLYIRLMMLLTPRPDISFVLDADPISARARKPEYPLEFIYINRQSYIDLSELFPEAVVIPPLTVEDVTRSIIDRVMKARPLSAAPPAERYLATASQSESAIDHSVSRPVA
jgi:thymidylate kinase